MPAMNPSQARVIDPVLTNIAQGYTNPEFVGGALFPQVPVGQRAGKIITFGKEDFMLYQTARAPGENTKRVSFGYAGSNFSLVDYSLEGALPIEIQQEAVSGANGFSIDAAAMTIRKVQRIMALRLEKAQADLARNDTLYAAGNKTTLTSTARWSDFTGTSNPIKDVEAAKEAIRAKIGRYPNTLVMGAKVMSSVRQHPAIVDRMKYTGRDVATTEILSSLFGIENVRVGGAIYANDAGTFSDVWGTDVVIGYTELGSLGDMGAPTYGYTYNLGGYPVVEEPYYDRNSKSWYFPVSSAEAPVIAGVDAGYVIKTAVS